MIQRDYIMDMIEQLGAALRKIVAKKRAEKFQPALAEVDEAARSLVGVDGAALAVTPLEALMELCTTQGEFDPAKAIAVACLLRERVELMRKMDPTSVVKPMLVKSFCLFDEISKLPDGHEVLDPHRDAFAWVIARLDDESRSS